jgi:membrane-anchored protein YejM (alkaline phosphatase superfamily)
VLSFGIGLALIATDAKVFELYRFHLNAMVMNLIFGGALQDNLSFSLNLWLTILAIVSLIFGSQFYLVWRLNRIKTQSNWFRAKRCWSMSFVLFLAANVMHGWYEAKANTAVVSQTRYVPWFQALTMRSLLTKMGVEVNVRDRSGDLMADQHSALHYPKAPLQCRAERPLNIIILMIDSMRFDMLQTQTMPTVNAFAQSSLRFENHYSTGNATRYGVFGFFYGLPANYWSAMLAEERGSVFIDQLKAQHYQLNLLASASLSNPEFDRTAFANVRDSITLSPRKASIAERDQWVTQQMLERLDKVDGQQPFFAFAFYDAPHGFGLPKGFVSPFQPMVEEVNYLTLGPDSDRESFFNRYKASVLFVDQEIEKVLEKIEQKAMWDNSVVIITSDHGQEFNDLGKNFWGHNNNYADYQVKVPLLIRWPGKNSQMEQGVTSHEDLVPTLMTHVLGCTNPLSDYSTGVDLFSPRPARVLGVESWSDRAVLHGDRIYQYNNLGQTDVFDKQYNEVDESPDAKVVKEVLERMTTFFQ